MAEREKFFKYLTPSNEDITWGLYLHVAGFAHIVPNDTYPPEGHPTGYSFNWDKGRVLNEFQINYITDGSGILETRFGKFNVPSGSVIFLSPGLWHRYRPNKKTGWKEHFIGFAGDITSYVFQEKFLPKQKPLIYIGFQDKILNHFHEIFNTIKEEKPGYQQVCSGLTFYMISNIMSISKNREFSGKEIEKKIKKTCLLLRESLNKNIDAELLAKEANLGYSHFRRVFKKYTGLSPSQYHQQLRLQKARDLLISTNLSIKQIAYELGFQSNYYFTRIFTKRNGVSPSVIRKGFKRNNE